MKKNKIIFLLLPCLLALQLHKAAAQQDSVAAEEVVKLKYFNDNNSLQYLLLENFLKRGKKTEPRANTSFELYLDSKTEANLIGKVTTNQKGIAKSFLPPSLKDAWNAGPMHTFLAVGATKDETATGELEITRAKMQLDTTFEDGTRNITVKVMKYENNQWLPANEVEMKVGIQRLGAILSAGDAETYTTDSTGLVTVELNKINMPGDERGNIVLAATVEDNDQFGNLVIEKKVPWGAAVKPDNTFFDQRTLWSTRFRTPWWLLFMAYSIVLGVWGTIVYLIFQIAKIKKEGTSVPS